MMIEEWNLIEEFRDLNLMVEVRPKSLYLGTLKINNDFLMQIQNAQLEDQYLQDRVQSNDETKGSEFHRDLNGLIRFKGREFLVGYGIKKEIIEYVAKCLTCQKLKAEHQTVIIDRLTKTTHFIPINMKYKLEKLAELYITEIVKLHGVSLSIISDRDPRFTSKFWENLPRSFGTKLKLSSSYHPQTDGQTELTIQTLKDLLRACVMEQQGSWDKSLPLVEFTYNNSYHASIGMAPYEALMEGGVKLLYASAKLEKQLCMRLMWYRDRTIK
ncbi:uncharacterized protein LOC113866891 [Abrus precatorius]|uniref:Uncharacterized protein LOC113866891 n=1 Tax=Abrus precatorius TaxID=3816 RepID=A0A8B8LMK3_ABRPR|nr:uncharacterized protein LOC113866891 [Abrus precatorius]